MSRCLVIGANGFIGSHVVDALAGAGHDVTAFDRFSSGKASFTAPNVRWQIGDFLSHADLSEALVRQQYVFHFLSTTTPAIADDEPTLDIRTNIAQSVDLFQLCADSSIEKIYFASTGGAIYGDQGLTRYRETDLALPVSPYGIGKLAIEHYLRYFRAKHGIESVSLRISNPYGSRQHPQKKQGLIPIALRQISLGRPVVRFGPGSMIRDFIHVEDVARIISAMTGVETAHDVYNLGSGRGNSINSVLDAIQRVTRRDFRIQEVPTPPTYVNEVVLDTSRISAEFSIAPLISLDDGIAQTWADQLQTPTA